MQKPAVAAAAGETTSAPVAVAIGGSAGRMGASGVEGPARSRWNGNGAGFSGETAPSREAFGGDWERVVSTQLWLQLAGLPQLLLVLLLELLLLLLVLR